MRMAGGGYQSSNSANRGWVQQTGNGWMKLKGRKDYEVIRV